MDQQGWLGIERIIEILFGTFPGQARERKTQQLICLSENLTGDGIGFDKLSSHPQALRTLTGKDECGLLRLHILLQNYSKWIQDFRYSYNTKTGCQ